MPPFFFAEKIHLLPFVTGGGYFYHLCVDGFILARFSPPCYTSLILMS